MWRPVALSAFLALLFMSSRSGQTPVETNTNDLAKSDFGAAAAQESQGSAEPGPITIDLANSSAHRKIVPMAQAADKQGDDASEDAPVRVASAALVTGEVIPLPDPKTDPSDAAARVVVTQGEQKTALSTDDEAVQLLPPGPDFAAKVQRELARLGCYPGRVDNIWGPMSRNAVARFNRVAKSKLPLKQPTRALLSSARKAPDNYCNNRGQAQARVASLDLDAGLAQVKSRPSYLPPWMRGEPMPEPEPQAEQEPEAGPAETPQVTRQAAREPSSTASTRAVRREPARIQRRQVRRQARRSRSAWQRSLPGWPGSAGR
jgi:hypothetical protein